jgi:hypothetical protein
MLTHCSTQNISEKKLFPFMNLLFEVREHIYSHLIPNIKVKCTTSPVYYLREPLRHGRKPCCTALLLANRKIYHELVELWYSSTTYCIYLKDSSLFFVAKALRTHSTLPFGCHFLTSLNITVSLEYYSLEQAKRDGRYGWQSTALKRSLEWIKEIGDFFSASGSGNLKDPNLQI